MKRGELSKKNGFTLIEMLIVVIVLGILSAIIIPQIAVSTDDAKLNTLETNLTGCRKAIELYYYEHGSTYPGDAVPTTKPIDVTDTTEAFVAQLVRYTDAAGNIANAKTAVYKYGPYIKNGKLPTNPYNDKFDVVVDNTETDITVRDSSASDNGWLFYSKTGVFIAADGTAGIHDNL
ncbi:type II secretory system protein G [Candidatus Scalindua japonica]|uniref:Type II secretory system protein G n=1 Tax=Candidatus Scalindua japonica TaxID=1284222 RepID=A0A286TTL5_9BACT|nr:prepilin-type N-terminal cleavage/methylation domain-containing protein [Candidatus Scalindua japonica]GAX59217.1 type II secretory system protein G [Candidatus Scalindua japonica]